MGWLVTVKPGGGGGICHSCDWILVKLGGAIVWALGMGASMHQCHVAWNPAILKPILSDMSNVAAIRY